MYGIFVSLKLVTGTPESGVLLILMTVERQNNEMYVMIDDCIDIKKIKTIDDDRYENNYSNNWNLSVYVNARKLRLYKW